MKLEFKEIGDDLYVYALGRSYAVGRVSRMVHYKTPTETAYYVATVFPNLELFFTASEAKAIIKAITEHGTMLNVKLRVRGYD